MPAARRITYAQARLMTRHELAARLMQEAQRWQARPPRTDAQRAAYAEYVRCVHLTDPGKAIQAGLDLLRGVPNDYLDRRPCDDPPEGGADSVLRRRRRGAVPGVRHPLGETRAAAVPVVPVLLGAAVQARLGERPAVLAGSRRPRPGGGLPVHRPAGARDDRGPAPVTAVASSSIAELCLAALGESGGKAEAAAIHGKLAAAGLTPRQVRSGLHRLSLMHPPLVVCAERSGSGRGKPGVWHLTTAGRDRAAGRVSCGTGWPGL